MPGRGFESRHCYHPKLSCSLELRAVFMLFYPPPSPAGKAGPCSRPPFGLSHSPGALVVPVPVSRNALFVRGLTARRLPGGPMSHGMTSILPLDPRPWSCGGR
jgi:hypothetical protein